jgi:hypothetical protein
MEAVDQYGLVQWLSKIAPDSTTEHPFLDEIIRISSDENRWYPLPCSNQVLVKLNPGHFRHMNICNQAVGSRESGERKEISRRRKHRNGVPKRLDQSSHRVAKTLVVIDD